MPIRSECLFDADARQRGVDSYAKSAGNAKRVQLPATTSHHREVVSRGGHHTFVRPSDGCADAEAPVAGPHPANACQPPSAPCGVGAGPTSWTAIPAWQHLDGRALPTRRTSPASRRPPRMGTRHPIPLLPTGKPLRGTTPLMMMMKLKSLATFTNWLTENSNAAPMMSSVVLCPFCILYNVGIRSSILVIILLGWR